MSYFTPAAASSCSAVRELIDPRTFECKKLEKQLKEGDPTRFGFRLNDCGAGVAFLNVP